MPFIPLLIANLGLLLKRSLLTSIQKRNIMKTIKELLAFKLFILSLSMFTNTTYAMPIDNGSYTTSGNMDWLDVTITQGMSVTEVLAETQNNNSNLFGWRYATSNEFEALMFDFGFTPNTTNCTWGVTFCDKGTGEISGINNAISWLGDTYDAYLEKVYIGTDENGLDVDNGYGNTKGILADTFEKNGLTYHRVALIQDEEYSDMSISKQGVNIVDFVDTYNHSHYPTSHNHTLGSFLVRGSSEASSSGTISVPEPSTFALLLLGLSGLAFQRKRFAS